MLSLFICAYLFSNRMTPRIENIASKEINQFIQILINHTSFTQKIDTHKLYKKENNSISFQMNYINDIASNYIHNLEETLLKLEEGSYQENNHSPYNKKLLKINQQKGIVARIPIGSLTNNIFLQDRGPSFSIKYKTLSLTSSNIDKKIKNYGINHLAISIDLNVTIVLQILVPLYHEHFKEKEITKLKGKYQYHLDIGKIEGLKNFQSFSINKKTKQNEVYVNHALITKIKQNKLIYKLNHHQYTLKIKGVIQDDYQEPVLYYHSLSNAIALQCIDVSTCIVYVKNHKYMKDYLTHLSVQYQGIAPIYEEYESYFKVIDLFKKVSLVFIFLSFMIAIVLMGYMVLSMFYENQKIFAIMLANGYQNHHLAFFILKKISLMMISIGIVSCLVSSGVLKIISFFDIS